MVFRVANFVCCILGYTDAYSIVCVAFDLDCIVWRIFQVAQNNVGRCVDREASMHRPSFHLFRRTETALRFRLSPVTKHWRGPQ